MQFHVINFVRTTVVNEKSLMPKLPKKLFEHKKWIFRKQFRIMKKKIRVLLELVKRTYGIYMN